MMGTFGGALEARKIDASEGRLTADVIGEVEKEEGVLVIRRIHVALRLCGPGAGPRNGRARSRHVRDALPSVPYPAHCDPTHFFLYADASDR